MIEWRVIKAYSKYQISDEGTVKNIKTGKVKTPCYDGQYWRVNLCEDIKNHKGKFLKRFVAVHRLVATTFIEQNDERRKYIDHIDSNRDNADLRNLRWVTARENKTYGHDIKGRKAVLQLDMKGQLIKRWESAADVKEAHPDYNVHHISSCCLNRKGRKSHKGFKWAYGTPTVKKAVRDVYKDEEFVNIGRFDNFDFQDYFVSNYGMIKNARGMVLTPFDNKGYYTYTLYDKLTGKSHQVFAHRAVAFKFCSGRTEERNIVNHIDEMRKNNHCINLNWVTLRENSEHSTAKAVNQLTLDGTFVRRYQSLSRAAEAMSIDVSSICQMLSGRYASTGGCKWEYAI